MMDLQMPVMDGITATRLARERGVKIPIVAYSAEQKAETQMEAMAAGANEYLVKPAKADAILATLYRLLQAS